MNQRLCDSEELIAQQLIIITSLFFYFHTLLRLTYFIVPASSFSPLLSSFLLFSWLLFILRYFSHFSPLLFNYLSYLILLTIFFPMLLSPAISLSFLSFLLNIRIPFYSISFSSLLNSLSWSILLWLISFNPILVLLLPQLSISYFTYLAVWGSSIRSLSGR